MSIITSKKVKQIKNSIGLSVLFFLIPLFAYGQPTPGTDTSVTAKSHFDRGVSLEQKKEFERAIHEYTETIRLDPNDAEAYFRRGTANNEKKDYDSAIEDLTQAIRLDPNKANYYYVRGAILGRKNDFDRAIEDYTQAIKLDPNNAFYYAIRGLVYGSNRDFDYAIEDFQAALRIDPKINVQEPLELAKKMAKQKADQASSPSSSQKAGSANQTSTAKTAQDQELVQLEKIAEQGDAEAQFQLGEMYLKRGDIGNRRDQVITQYQQGFQWINKAAEQGNVAALKRLGDIYYNGLSLFGYGNRARSFVENNTILVRRDESKGIELYQKAAMKGDIESHRWLSKVYYEDAKYPEALEWYERASKQGDSYSQYRAGDMYASGTGVIRDRKKGCELLRPLAEQGAKSGAEDTMKAALTSYNKHCAD